MADLDEEDEFEGEMFELEDEPAAE